MVNRRRNEDELVRLAQYGVDLQAQYDSRVAEVSGQKPMTAQDLVDLYMRANYEQRHQMFREILASNGPDGLEVLGNVYRLAQELHAGEGEE